MPPSPSQLSKRSVKLYCSQGEHFLLKVCCAQKHQMESFFLGGLDSVQRSLLVLSAIRFTLGNLVETACKREYPCLCYKSLYFLRGP